MEPTAEKAINILTALQKKTDNASVAFWVAPNAILTLSGARGYCDGVFYSDDMPAAKTLLGEIEAGIKILKSIADVYSVESGIFKNPRGDTYCSYDLIMRDGLSYAFSQTKLIEKGKETLLEKQLSSAELQQEMWPLLKSQKRFETLSDQNLHDHAFGILLGYPDDAILSSTKLWDGTRDKPFAEPFVDADIRGGQYYLAPTPIYLYPRRLMSSPLIQKHETLWSKILKDFYMSDFHEQLVQDKQFQQRLIDLGYKIAR